MTQPGTRKLRERLAKVNRAHQAVMEVLLSAELSGVSQGDAALTMELLHARLKALSSAVAGAEVEALLWVAVAEGLDEAFFAERARVAEFPPLRRVA